MLTCNALDVRIADRTLVSNLDLDVRAGEIIAVLGPNGAGKSLTLLSLAGLRPADAGEIRLGEQTLDNYPRRRLAQELALLPQHIEDAFPATVAETALIGRFPYAGLLGIESASDIDLSRQALERVGLAALSERDVQSLSGGERRRLAVAQILAQDPGCFLLDEPLNHLDPQHQLEVLGIFRALADQGRAVVASLHDVNLASRFADRVLALHGDGRWHCGTTDEVLRPNLLSELFSVNMDAVTWRDRDLFVPTTDA